jgi:hypothetical protein
MANFKFKKMAVLVDDRPATLLKLWLKKAAATDPVDLLFSSLKAAFDKWEAEDDFGGQLALVNGPFPREVLAMVIEELRWTFDTVAIFSPREKKYVVSIAGTQLPPYRELDRIPEEKIQGMKPEEEADLDEVGT